MNSYPLKPILASAVLLFGGAAVGQVLAPPPLSHAAASATTSLPGRVVALFVTTGAQVKRGQLLVKLKQANGQSFFVSAPVAGRVALAPVPVNTPLPAHTVLATVTPTP